MSKSPAKNILSGIVTVAIIGFLIYSRVDSSSHVKEFNSYIKKVRTLLAKQDALMDEVQKTPETAVQEKVPKYIERSDALTKSFQAITTSDEELAKMHPLFAKRSEAISAALHLVLKYDKSKDKKDLDAQNAKWTEARKHLDAFVAQRDAYFKKHDIELEK
jgi:hypothetical protein